MGKIVKILLVLLFVAGVSLGAYSWLSKGKKGEKGIELIDVAMGSITEKAVAVGQIKPRVEFHVK